MQEQHAQDGVSLVIHRDWIRLVNGISSCFLGFS